MPLEAPNWIHALKVSEQLHFDTEESKLALLNWLHRHWAEENRVAWHDKSPSKPARARDRSEFRGHTQTTRNLGQNRPYGRHHCCCPMTSAQDAQRHKIACDTWGC